MKKYSIYIETETGEVESLEGTRDDLGLSPDQLKKKKGFILYDGTKLRWNTTGLFKPRGVRKRKDQEKAKENPLDPRKVTFQDIRSIPINVCWSKLPVSASYMEFWIDRVLLKNFITNLEGKQTHEIWDLEEKENLWCTYSGFWFLNPRDDRYYPHPNQGIHSKKTMEMTEKVAEDSWEEICEFLDTIKDTVSPGYYNLLVKWCKRHTYRLFDMEFKSKKYNPKFGFRFIFGLVSRLDFNINQNFMKYPGVDIELELLSSREILEAYLKVLESVPIEELIASKPKRCQF